MDLSPDSFEVFARLHHNLGVHLDSQRLFDFRGPLQYVAPREIRPIAELLSA